MAGAASFIGEERYPLRCNSAGCSVAGKALHRTQVLAGRENMSGLLSVILPVQVGVIWIFLCCLKRLQQDRLLSAMHFVS